jgi:two-component system, chemotaxis family, sensor kinase Cph1
MNSSHSTIKSLESRSFPLDRDYDSIHNFGMIQSHGCLLSLQPNSLTILQVSDNIKTLLNLTPEDLLGKTLDQVFPKTQVTLIKKHLHDNEHDTIPVMPLKLRLNKTNFDGIIHLNPQGFYILELESINLQEKLDVVKFYHSIRMTVTKMHQSANLTEMSNILVEDFRKITGFDRVLIYRYDHDWHGVVIAEAKSDQVESYLGLHYPESDVPQIARKLYVKTITRTIPNFEQNCSYIIPEKNPITNSPLDLTFTILRGVHPCHIEYYKNWGVQASMSVALVSQNHLWGLIACQHYTPKYIPYDIRKACEFLGQIMSLELTTKEANEVYDYQLELKTITSQLVGAMSHETNFIEALVKQQLNFLKLVSAQGAVICIRNQFQLFGNTPTQDQIEKLLIWLKNNSNQDIFYTANLAKIYPEAQEFKAVGSGILAISISSLWDHYIIWFRPEEIQTVNWAGNPNESYQKTILDNGKIYLSPRSSFELWKEKVNLKSLPWEKWEIQAAIELRNGIIDIILKQVDELAHLTQELRRSNAELQQFAYVASHDLQEPLNQVVSYVQLLEMRYQDILDDNAKEFINFAVEGVTQMQQLIDDLLAYSRLGSRNKKFESTDLKLVFKRVLMNLQVKIEETKTIIDIPDLPIVNGDDTQLLQLFQNLITNAIKFRNNNKPEIKINVQENEDHWLFSVQDNGIGIDPQFKERIFVIFQRLHTRDEYPGTGMGLTICKRIVERHGGKIWVESELGQGATFYFTIAK